jgi:hypothetical protein
VSAFAMQSSFAEPHHVGAAPSRKILRLLSATLMKYKEFVELSRVNTGHLYCKIWAKLIFPEFS